VERWVEGVDKSDASLAGVLSGAQNGTTAVESSRAATLFVSLLGFFVDFACLLLMTEQI
jgi:hypothetical protein